MVLIPETLGRLRTWPTWELSAILLVVTSSTMGYQWNRGPRFTNRTQIMLKGLPTPQRLSHLIIMRQLQQQILRKMNRRPPTPSPKELRPSSTVRKPSPLSPPNPDDTQMTFILAKASDPYRPDTMHFRISSYIRSHIDNVETAILAIRLRLSKKLRRALAERRGKLALQRKILQETTSSACKNNTMELEVPSSQKGDNSTEIIPLCGRSEGRNSLKRKRSKKLKRRLKPKKIKLVVRLLDAKKRRRLFAGEVLVKKTKIVTIPIPPAILKNTAESSNHTLTIQILCRKCRRKVMFDKVYRSTRKSRKKSTARRPRRLNPNRPSLTIKFSNKTTKMSESHLSKNRNKRHALNNYCSVQEHELKARSRSNDTETADLQLSDADFECCAERKYVTFEELGFGDWIIYPRGFTTAICLGSCAKESYESLATGPNEYVDAVDDTATKTTTAAPALQDRKCVPLDSSHLDIIYFVNSNTIASSQLANIVDNSCGCAL